MTTDTDKASDKLVEMALKAAFEKGWCAAAQWAQRDDLRHDTGSIAYAGQRDAILAGKAAEVRAAIIADLCGDVEPVARLLTWNGPAHTPVPHGGIAARTFTEFDKDTPAKDRYWFEGELLYPASTVAALKAERDAALARTTDWKRLYDRAINEANGLTNYVEDRPELRSAERRLDVIAADARALKGQP